MQCVNMLKVHGFQDPYNSLSLPNSGANIILEKDPLSDSLSLSIFIYIYQNISDYLRLMMSEQKMIPSGNSTVCEVEKSQCFMDAMEHHHFFMGNSSNQPRMS